MTKTKEIRPIYVASRVKHAEMWKKYRDAGTPIISSWIDEAGDGDTADFGELWQRIRREIGEAAALVFYAASVEDFPFKGALVEVGIALAMEKPVYAVLNDVMIEGRTLRPVGSWLLDRNVKRYEDLDDALIAASLTPKPEFLCFGETSGIGRCQGEQCEKCLLAARSETASRDAIIEECAKVADSDYCLPRCDSFGHEELCPIVNPYLLRIDPRKPESSMSEGEKRLPELVMQERIRQLEAALESMTKARDYEKEAHARSVAYYTARSETAEVTNLRAFAQAFRDAYPNIRQLQDGFATDTAVWSEWDESVRQETIRLGKMVFDEAGAPVVRTETAPMLPELCKALGWQGGTIHQVVERVALMRAALREITRGAGPFHRDPLKHADNCIESMKSIATGALEGTWTPEE